MITNIATIVGESSVGDMPAGDDDWDFGVAVGLDKVERVGVNRRFWIFKNRVAVGVRRFQMLLSKQ